MSDTLYWWHVLDTEGLLHFTANVFHDALAALADNNPQLDPPRKKARFEDAKMHGHMSTNIGKVGTGIHNLSLVALSRQINELKNAQYELDMKLDDFPRTSRRYERTKLRIDEYDTQIEDLTREYNKLKKQKHDDNKEDNNN